MPEYFWPYTPGQGRQAAWAVTTRLELQFHGRVRLPEPEDPEPEDPPPPGGADSGDGTAPGAAERAALDAGR